ncbi:MAG TPA: hypothetical protein VMH23_00590 [Bacteroidota bacterium]|nr:hypothetical protein [Bacteroidota bacterium]
MIKQAIFVIVLLTLAVLGCNKSNPTSVEVSTPTIQIGQSISSDTLPSAAKGTCLSGKTYYFKSDVTVNAGDTLYLQAGTKLIAICDGLTPATSPMLLINGTFISDGTKAKPVWITVPDLQRTTSNLTAGLWGGIQTSTTSGDVIIKWTHIEYTGGPSPAGLAPYAQGDSRWPICFNNINANFVLYDSWITGSKDDGVRVMSGKIAVFRNTFECLGSTGGDMFNVKNGTVGDAGYNLFIGGCTNGGKLSNSGTTAIQENVNFYNNTMINCGLRQVQSGRGGSMNLEKGGKGMLFNNMIVNCRFGFRLTSDADTAHTTYGNTFYYANAKAMVSEFNATTGVAKTQQSDVRIDTLKKNNPLFVNYDVDQFDFSTITPPVTFASMVAYPGLLIQGTSDFNLKSNSPAVGKGKTNFTPNSAVTISGSFAPVIPGPGIDIGAYQTNGSGNQH